MELFANFSSTALQQGRGFVVVNGRMQAIQTKDREHLNTQPCCSTKREKAMMAQQKKEQHEGPCCVLVEITAFPYF
jgi:hypothetical protein